MSEMQSQLKDELAVLTEAQAKLDEAMETITPLQQQVTQSRNKLKALSVAILKELGVVVRRGRGWMLQTAELPKDGLEPATPAQAAPAEQDDNVPEWVQPAKKATKKRGAKKVTRNYSPETRIEMARRAAEMQARRKGLSKASVRKAGNKAAERRRRELGV